MIDLVDLVASLCKLASKADKQKITMFIRCVKNVCISFLAVIEVKSEHTQLLIYWQGNRGILIKLSEPIYK